MTAGTTVEPDNLGMAYLSKDKIWQIYGASGGVGDRTMNLFSYAYYFANKVSPNMATNDYVIYTLSPNTKYTISTNYPLSGDAAIFFAKSGVYSSPRTSSDGLWDGQTRTITTDSQGRMFIASRNARSAYQPPNESDFINRRYWIKIEEGANATKFEPYGYKIPIQMTSAQDTNTINIYSDAQLGDGDMLTIMPKKSAMRNDTE